MNNHDHNHDHDTGNDNGTGNRHPTEPALNFAATRLSAEGIWSRRDFWVDEDGLEVEADDPRACNPDHSFEVNYRSIVERVVAHLAEYHDLNPDGGTDWIGDPILSPNQKMERFQSLSPQQTRGPRGATR